MVPLRALPLSCVAIALLYWGLSSDGGIVDCGSSVMSPHDKCTTTCMRGSSSTRSTLGYEEQRERNRRERLVVGGSSGILALPGAGAIITQSRQKSRKNEARRGADRRYNLEIEFLEAIRGTVKPVNSPDGSLVNLAVPPGTENGCTLHLPGKGGQAKTAASRVMHS